MHKLILTLILLLSILSAGALADWKHEPPVAVGPYMASGSTVIVTFKDNYSVAAIADLWLPEGMTLARLSSKRGVSLPPAHYAGLKSFGGADISHGLVKIQGYSVVEAIEKIESLPHVKAAEPNYLHRPFWTPNDPHYADHQGNFRQIYVDKAWDIVWGEGVIVAIIDSGFKKDMMEDPPESLVQGYDFWGEDNDVDDFIGHGTHISNTVAEATNNGIGCAGIAFKASILPCKVFPDEDGGAYESDIIDAVYWAVDQGAHVINMSLGGGGYVGASRDAMKHAVDSNVVVFAASGNDGTSYIEYPSKYESVIAVGATSQHAPGATIRRARFSQYGSGLDVVAPGTAIFQETFSGDNRAYYGYYGTSSASPHAAGVAALLISRRGPGARAIRDALETTATNPDGDWTDELGWGEINAWEALIAYQGDENEPPVAVATAFPGVGAPPLEVNFVGDESYDPDGEIDRFRWVLQTGEIIGETVNIEYTFNKEQEYSVSLNVTDDEGITSIDYVTIDVTTDVDFDSDPCYTTVYTAYNSCGIQIKGEDDDYYTDPDLVVEICRAAIGDAPWDCLLECFEHDDVNGCKDFAKCASAHCDVDIRTLKGSSDKDDDDDFCGFCG